MNPLQNDVRLIEESLDATRNDLANVRRDLDVTVGVLAAVIETLNKERAAAKRTKKKAPGGKRR
jgi:hypothetical protein